MWILISTIAAVSSLLALYALHRFRPRARPHPIATLIFWEQAVGSQNVTAPSQKRFSQPRTFILLAAILLLLAVGTLAGSLNVHSDKLGRVVVIDTGSNMRWSATDDSHRTGTLLDHAIDAVENTNQNSDSPTVIAASDIPKLIAQAAEPAALLQRQLDALRPVDGAAWPIASASALALNLAGNLGKLQPEIDWYTDQSSIPRGVAPSVAACVHIHALPTPAGRAGITDILFENANSIPSAEGQLRVRVARSTPVFSNPLAIALSSPATPTRVKPVAFAPDTLTADVIFADIPTDGSAATLTLQLASSPTTFYQQIPIQLPQQPAIRIEIGTGISPALRAAAQALNSSASKTAAHAIALIPSGSPLPPDATASVQIVSQGAMLPAGIPITAAPDQPLTAGLDFEDAITAAGPAVPSDDPIPILRAGDSVVASFDPANHTAYLSSALVNDPADLPRRAAFPVLLNRLFRTLSGWTELPPSMPASRILNDPLWQAAAAPGSPIAFAEITNNAPPAHETAPPPSKTFSFRIQSSPRWALAAALLLLTFEGVLLARRKIT
jgi:hypothetical protein